MRTHEGYQREKFQRPKPQSSLSGRYIVQHALGDGASGRVLRTVLKRSVHGRYLFPVSHLQALCITAWFTFANSAEFSIFLTSGLHFRYSVHFWVATGLRHKRPFHDALWPFDIIMSAVR